MAVRKAITKRRTDLIKFLMPFSLLPVCCSDSSRIDQGAARAYGGTRVRGKRRANFVRPWHG